MHRYFILICFTFCLIPVYPQTQSDGQIWLDGELNYNFTKRFLFQDELSYQTLVSGGNYWYSINTTPTLEYSLTPRIDLISAIPLSYTRQNHQTSSFEIRLMTGTRFYITPHSRAQTRLLVRLEQRWNHDIQQNEWDIENRLRIRGEFVYPINKHTYYENDMWYLISDAEIFLSAGGEVSERFANRARFRLGVGYRLSEQWRFEGIYTCQLSRNSINDRVNSVSNIIRLRLKYYFQ